MCKDIIAKLEMFGKYLGGSTFGLEREGGEDGRGKEPTTTDKKERSAFEIISDGNTRGI
jgi:hypothetical protein